jgi:alpha/beta superfamily hydrolase
MEKKVTFISQQFVLEGMYNKLSETQGAIITHPHPLYGGDMSNPVVESLAIRMNLPNLFFDTIKTTYG